MKSTDKLTCIEAYQPYYTDEYENVYYVLTSTNNCRHSLLPLKENKGHLLAVKGFFEVNRTIPFSNGNLESASSTSTYLVEALPALKDIKYAIYYPSTIAIPIEGVKREGLRILLSAYITFKDQVFVSSIPVKEVDINTFSIFPNSMFAKDKNWVYYKNSIVKKADPKTFEVVSAQFQKDNEHVWYMGSMLCADSQSFKVFTSETNVGFKEEKSLYACDKKHVFYQYLILDEADLKTFKVLKSVRSDELYGVDERRVFYHHMYLEYADAKSFRVITEQYEHLFENPDIDAFDKNYKYTCGNRITLTEKEKEKLKDLCLLQVCISV